MKQANKWMTQFFAIISSLLLLSLASLCQASPLSTPISPAARIALPQLYALLEAELALQRELRDIGLANYIEIAHQTQDPAIAKRATQIALSLNAFTQAQTPLEIWANRTPNDLDVQLTGAAIYLSDLKISAAMPFLEQIRHLDPDTAQQHYLRLYQQLNRPPQQASVIAALTQLLKHSTTENSVQLALTKIFLYQNQPQKALPFISAALALTPEQLEVILLKAQTLAANQQWLTAQNFIEGQLEKFPEAGVLRQFYTELLIQQGEFSAARQQLKQLKAAYLPAPQLLQLAHLSMQVHWYPEAEAFLKQAEKLPDFKSTALYFLAHLAIIQEKTELAIERYQQVTEGPFHIIAYTQASLLMAQQQQVDAALALLQAMRPSNAAEQTQIILTQAEILLSIQAYPQAYSLLSQQLMRDPTHIQLRYTRALIANERQHFKLAIEDLTQILAIEPNHIDALNTLGFILADQTQRYTEATDYLQHALSLEPNNPMILDSVGWLEYKKGNYPMAIKVLNKALSLKPDPEIAAHLGEVLWNAQQQQAAKKVWRDAFNAEPENLMLYETMQRHLKPNALPRMKQPQH